LLTIKSIGTHVSGIIAGKKYGVAKQAKLVSVQVLDKNGKGSMSNLIAGLDWVAKHAKRGSSIVNLSLGVAKTTPGAKALNQGTNIAMFHDNISSFMFSRVYIYQP
jgi:subtilisin family serine protease